jgi:oxygen-independent coproporphyrinogen-3 oxidase
MRLVPFESFTYPFFDFGYNADHQGLAEAFLAKPDGPQKGMNGLYLHIPFCDTICGFCPFNKSVPNGDRVELYLDALVREIELMSATPRAQSMVFDAVYLGGGTPSILSERQLETLMTAARKRFSIAPDAEISFEFEPKSVTRGKLQTVRDLGATRVSFGVQTFDTEIRRIVNLTATRQQIDQAIDWSTNLFDRTNFDLMVGFPGQELESALLDVDQAVASGIASVSIYPVDYVMTLPKLLERIGTGEVPRPAPGLARHKMFHAARRALRNHFVEQNIYCYGKSHVSPCRYMFSILYGTYNEQCLGLGVGSYTSLNGVMYQNLPSEVDYVRSLGDNRLPIHVTSPYHAYEKGLVFFPKRLTYDTQDLDRHGLLEVYQPKIDAAEAAGLITREGTVLRLTEDGQNDYGAMMTDFFSDHQQRLYRRICAKLSRTLGWLETADAIDVAKSRKAKTWGALTSMASASSS